MIEPVTLLFEDGVEVGVDVEDGQTVLDAALDQGLNLVHQCRSGSCASCICTIIEGEAESVPGRAAALLKSEAAAGMRLSCSLMARGGLVLRFPYPYDLTQGPAPIVTGARVEGAERLSSAVWLVSLDAEEALGLQAGQYVRLRVPGTMAWRSYSVASQPSDEPRIDLLVKERAGGTMSAYLLDQAKRGDETEVEGPFGGFVLREHGGPFLFIAGGTGLAPVVPLLDDIRERMTRKPPVTVCFACSYEEELFYLDELELREHWMPNLTVLAGVSRPNEAWRGPVGNPLQLVDEASVTPDTLVYVCGAPGLVDGAQERLAALGVDPANIVSEQYLAEQAEVP